jgi:hypothetical protein
MGERRGVYKFLVEKPGGNSPLGRPRRRWENNNEMALQEVVWGCMAGSSWLGIGIGDGHL